MSENDLLDEERIGENTPWVKDDGRFTPTGADAMALYEVSTVPYPRVMPCTDADSFSGRIRSKAESGADHPKLVHL